MWITKEMMAAKHYIDEKIYWYRNTYSIVVYDECHYFYSDSNFNTYTELSYDFLRYCFVGSIQIFMSSTMANMERLIKQTKTNELIGDAVNMSGENMLGIQLDRQRYIYYECDRDYGYVKLKVLHDISDLACVIKNSKNKKDKWLVFVDSKEYVLLTS